MIGTGEEVFKAITNKHKEENQTGDSDDDLDNIIKETFEALDSGNFVAVLISKNTATSPVFSFLSKDRGNGKKFFNVFEHKVF